MSRCNTKAMQERIAELEAELYDTVTECIAARSNEDIMRKQLAELQEATQKHNQELKRQRDAAFDAAFNFFESLMK